MVILKYFSRCFLIGKSVSLVSSLPPCLTKGIVSLGATAQGMSYQRKRALQRKSLKTQEEGQDLHVQVLTSLLRHCRKPMTTVFNKASKHRTSLNPQQNSSECKVFPGGTDRMFYAPEKEEVHDTYANSWRNVFTMAKSECVHQSVHAWLKQIHCSLIGRVRFRKGLVNWGYSKFFIVHQLWNV